jgi:hypothetical protein
VKRLMTVAFGPSCSNRFGKALAEARRGAGDCRELEEGRYRVRFVLGTDPTVYASLGRLLERARHWRATEVFAGDELVSTYQAREMAWCASSQLTSFGDCRFRFYFGVPPRCALCPLLDARRAVHDSLGENTPAGMVFEIKLGPRWRALMGSESPTTSKDQLDPYWITPDFPPEEWGKPEGEELRD